ncbi:RNA polymerase sigma factor [Lunatibacter salilacus]|uniref:RNA polymerase sigma factor n=1 Tax=Lunatibacter salilacus TaxID=2483804 RepID=UPI00131B6F82|nr:sigma-70 family RNA polymerase sigma factor [Lunatibacter salilacus]
MKQDPLWNDVQILEELRNAQTINQALDRLYEVHYSMLEFFILQNSGSQTDAQDTIQETMVVFVNMVHDNKYRGDASIKSMLYSINRNVWLSELRRRKNRVQRDILFESEKEIEIGDYSEELIKMEGYKMMMELFDKLGKGCRSILTLFYFDNLSMEEIVEKEQLSSEQVLRNKKYKCMKALTAKIESSEELYEKVKTALSHGLQ